jgi:hypothetical protein
VVIAGKARLREFGYIAGKDDLRRINRLGGPIATLPKRAAVTPLFCYGYVVGGTGNGSDLPIASSQRTIRRTPIDEVTL